MESGELKGGYAHVIMFAMVVGVIIWKRVKELLIWMTILGLLASDLLMSPSKTKT